MQDQHVEVRVVITGVDGTSREILMPLAELKKLLDAIK